MMSSHPKRRKWFNCHSSVVAKHLPALILTMTTITGITHIVFVQAFSLGLHDHNHHNQQPHNSNHDLDSTTSISELPDSDQSTSTSKSKSTQSFDRLLVSDEDANVLGYLQKYGYMSRKQANSGANNLISEESFTDAIRSFQRFAGINETGLINSETIKLMQTPRCGNSDRETIKRKKRYALQGSKWRRQELSYRISQYPTRFSGKKHEVDSQIEKAFGVWSHVAPIDFVVKREGKVHIDIRFASGEHGDGDSFDGPGNTLAHAYFPQYGGDAHFDDQEYWTIDSYAGTNIFQVAAHELGHSLGLGHSNVREALMAPFYQKYKPHFKLHLDDVLAIQALYGEKPFLQGDSDPPSSATSSSSSVITSSSTTTSTTTSTAAPPTSSNQPKRPTVINGFGFNPLGGGHKETNDDEAPLFPDMTGNGIGSNGASDDALAFQGAGSPNKSPQLPRNPADLCIDSQIDAATRTEDGNSYVFKGNFYWQLTSEGLAKGFPRRISTDWEGLTGPIDAALTWADGKTFFFKGNKYWRFRNKRRDVGYPKLISSGFAGIPDDIDAAFVWSGNGRTYILKGSQYWRYDSKADPPVSGEYPRSIKMWRGVPSYINAALKWENNVTYFFKGNQYYRFNDKEFRVESRGRPSFPRPTAEWWFGCTGSNLAAQREMPASFSNNQQTYSIYNDNSRHYQNYRTGLIDEARIKILSESNKEWALLPSGNPSSMGTHINDRANIPPASLDLEPASLARNNPEPDSRMDNSQSEPLNNNDMDFHQPPILIDSSPPSSTRDNSFLRSRTPMFLSNQFVSSSTTSAIYSTTSLISITLFISVPTIISIFVQHPSIRSFHPHTNIITKGHVMR